MPNFSEVFSSMILLSSFILMANKRIKSYIRTFRIQSAMLALVTGVFGINSVCAEGRFDLLIICLLIIALKVIYIPNLLNKIYDKVDYKVEKDFYYNIPVLVSGCCALFVFVYFTVSSIGGQNTGRTDINMVNSVSVILIGLFFMISRKKAIGQIIGFLVIENGIFATAMFLTSGMPFIVDIGIFIDLITAVIIMGVMVFRINKKFESIDLTKLKNLRG